MQDQILKILERVASGELDARSAADKLPFATVPTAGAVVDTGRELRCGAPEIVYGQHKSAAQIAAAMEALLASAQRALCSRIDADKASAVQATLSGGNYDPVARCLSYGAYRERDVSIGIVSGGSSDAPVVAEISATLSFLGFSPTRFEDIGVAGIQRLFDRLESIRKCELLIACAGMEGALPSVVAGLVDVPVIGVPTSVGYGVSAGGVAALLTMLSSCAPGVVVVNIDNGVGAAISAAKFFSKR